MENINNIENSVELLNQVYPETLEINENEEYYSFLESKMRKYIEYRDINAVDSGEELIPIETSDYLKVRQIDERMLNLTGEDILVRESVYDKLQKIARYVSKEIDLSVEVVYGYRDLNIQRDLFEQIKQQEINNGFIGNELELFGIVHRSISVPEVAGHPTGGAVDLQLLKDNKVLDFGTNIWDFTKDSYTFSPFISIDAWNNRQLLRNMMVDQGFTPFDGEWWHFSYGDKEWAAANDKEYAVYDQIKYQG